MFLRNSLLLRRGSVLGYFIAVDLCILLVNRVPGPVTKNCNVVDDTFVKSLKAKFPRVFSGIDQLKNYKLKLDIGS